MAALAGRGRGWEKVTSRDMKMLKEDFVLWAPRWGSTGYAVEDKWISRVMGDNRGKESRIPGTMWSIVTASGAHVKGPPPNLPTALAAFRRMPESDRKPKVEDRGPHNPRLFYADVPPPKGALFVNVYSHPLDRAGGGRFRQAKHVELREFGGRGFGNSMPSDLHEPQRECLWLKEAEWKALMPAKPRKGDVVAIPAAVRQRFLLFYVFNFHINSGGGYWEPRQLRDGELKLTVADVSAKAVRMRLSGHALFKSEAPKGKPLGGYVTSPNPRETGAKLPATLKISYDVNIEGALEYDPAARKFTRFDAVALGDYRGPWGLAYKEKPVPVGVAFELDTREIGPEHRHAPFALSFVRENYWAPHRWKP